MAKKINVRSKWDRARYAVVFEVLLILMSAPVIAWVLEKEAMTVGTLTAVIALKALLVNVVYNHFYDRFDVKAGRVPTQRSGRGRIAHALGLEMVLTVTSMPIVMWWLQIDLLTALAMDVVLMGFIVLYAYVYTWAYDRVFPVVQPADDDTDTGNFAAA